MKQLEWSDGRRSLQAASGDIILLSGKNGSGKTLYLHRLAGLLPMPEDMRLQVNQQAVEKQPVRMLFDQWPAIWLGQSIHEEMQFGCNRSLDPQQVEEMLACWSIPGTSAEADPYTLNRMQAVRMNMAAIQIAEPALALLDNPTDALPSDDAARLISDISLWAQHSKTVIVVACNRWQDWRMQATQHWHVISQNKLPQARGDV